MAYFNIPPFVATLGMQMSVRGAVYMLTGGMTITETGENFKVIGQGYVGPVPNPVLIMLLCAVVFWVLLDRTRLGRNFYAVGGNREAARASGISLRKYTIYAYMVAGAFTGLGELFTVPGLMPEHRPGRKGMKDWELLPRSSAASDLQEGQAMHGER